ncbi:hypothetical protein ACUSIJ_22660 [Pseudochelatococcus sp. B33]
MRFLGFTATPDLMGRRIRLSWSYALEAGEVPGGLPDVLIRRKTRDFAFPPLAVPDPYLVHDSATFPPAPVPGVLTVTDLPDRSARSGPLEGQTETVSVARISSGVPLEIQRWSRTIWRNGAGQARLVEGTLLDAEALTVGETYYYELDDGSAPGPEDLARYRSVVRAGEIFGYNRQLWSLLPDAYRGADPQLLPASAHVPGIPETSRAGGQLKRFSDTFGMGIDFLRNGANGLIDLRDPERAPAAMLAALGRQIGWYVAPSVPLEQSRNEVETATRLFALGGTIQAMRALINHQTGWSAQAVEMEAGLWRSGQPARGLLRFLRERPAAPGVFGGGLDAAPAFAFPPGGAVGGVGMPAILTAGAAEPYALAPGLELTLSVNGAEPTRVVFGPDDFADIGAARAVEVAAVIDRHFDDLTAADQAGALALATHLDTPEASIVVETSRESLLALSETPRGRISPVADDGRLRLFYGTREERPGADRSTKVLRRLAVKSFGFGEWRDEVVLPAWGPGNWGRPGADEAAAALVGSDYWLAFASGERLALARGRGRPPAPAELVTAQPGPYALTPGQQLVLVTQAGSETFTVNAVDYAVPASASTIELAAAMNAQLANVSAVALAEGGVRLSTLATGETARLSIDLANSTTARPLGLARRGLASSGTWDPAIDWRAPESGPLTAGPLASPAAAAYSGGALLGWAEHQDGAWTIRTAHWRDGAAAATPLGLAEREAGAPWVLLTMADGLPSDDIRAVLTDARGVLAAATDAGLALRPFGGAFATLDTGGGLPSDDLRALAATAQGLAVATAAGLAEIAPGGAPVVTVAGPDALLDDDLRALAATPEGGLLVGSATGLSVRDRFGIWTRHTPADGLPPGPIIAVAASGPLLLAGSAGGLSLFDGAEWRALDERHGLPSTDIRALLTTPGRIVAATAAGIAHCPADRLLRRAPWQAVTAAEGLPFADCRSVALGPEDRLIVGGPSGVAISGPDGQGMWQLEQAADGLPAAPVVGLDGAWSAPQVLAAPPGGAVEPHLAQTADGFLWCAYARRGDPVAGDRDDWLLELRRFDPAAALWEPPQPLAAALATGSADREPFVLPQPAGGARVFLSTDRSGGRGLAEIPVDAAGVPSGPLVSFAADPAEAWAPGAVAMDAEVWVFHRGERPYAPAQIASLDTAQDAVRPSLRLAAASSLASPAGLRTPVLAHLPRHAMRHQPGDPMAYTPDEPDKGGGAPEDPVPLHSRRTVALHLAPAPFGLPPTQERIERLFQLLNDFKPINTRLRLVIRPSPLIEVVYPPGADIGESWSDNAPFTEVLGAMADGSGVVYPGLAVLLAHDTASRVIDFADPATFRRRTWFPDLA